MTTRKADTGSGANNSRPDGKATSGLNEAIEHFLKFNESPEEVRNALFKVLHLAFESNTVDSMDRFERSTMFFVIREMMVLSDALHHFKQERDALLPS